MPENSNFNLFADKMRAEDLPQVAIKSFEYYYRKLTTGESGLLSECAITPVGSLPDVSGLDPGLAAIGAQNLERTVVVKLNGGLGTSMGLERAKSLLVVRPDLTFLDIIARQAVRNRCYLLLMNSFATEQDSLRILERYPELRRGIPLSFLQHKVPKVRKDDLTPVEVPDNPGLEWCPPGHGDIYLALRTSGLLDQLLQSGLRYAFVSNSDNLGAILEPLILGYFASKEIPFLMEVADRTESDRKGGHLARLKEPDARFVLRESAQCPAADLDDFQDIRKHRHFNTNNLWIDLMALSRVQDQSSGFLPLPMIRNEKTVNPADPSSTPVFQLETAMGAAISVFPGAAAIRVPRDRFAPVKTCGDLLAVRSDATVLTEDWRVVPNPERLLPPPVVELDPRYFRLIGDLEKRFPYGPPSLIRCKSFRVHGDFEFERNVVCRGQVVLSNRGSRTVRIQKGEILDGVRDYD